MYGIGNSYFNYGQLYSSMMFGGKNYGNYGGGYGSGGLFGANATGFNAWNSMVPNYAQINYSLLGKYLTNNYDDIRDKLGALSNQKDNATSFYKDFNSTFNDLKSSASSLKSFSDNSVFHPTGYGSSDSSVASVTSKNAAGAANHKVDVKQTAAAQSYSTAAASSTGNSLSGSTSLTLTDADGKKNTFNFTFSPSGNNKSYLSKIASTVNDQRLGITASVTEKDGKSTLTFKSDKTGEENSFTAKFAGDNASKFNLTEQQKAQDAIYKVDDGEEQTSSTNDVTVGSEKIGVTLKGEGTTQISKNTKDDSRTVDAVKSFAENYNKALAFLNKNADASSAVSSLAYSFSSTRFQSGALSKIGIAVDNSGALTVDADKLTKALQTNRADVEKALGGASGLATNAYGKAVNAMNNSRNLYPQSPSVSYSNYMYGRDRSYISSYMNGMFLSSLI